MKACGIVAEYNPFHNGHMYHLNRSLEITGADVSIAVISGDFTERGELALLDKWNRAEIAVKNGINLVVEMPTIFACNNAGYFAKAGIEILEALNADDICFGVESNPEKIVEISRLLVENEQFIEDEIKARVKQGFTYPRAREEAISTLTNTDYSDVLSKSNNVLAIEYLKDIKNATPVMIERIGVEYNDLNANGSYASASAIRAMITNSESVDKLLPKVTFEALQNQKLANNELFFNIFMEKALSLSSDEMNKCFGAEEGLGSIIKRDFRKWSCYDDMIISLKSKRYTDTRIRRTLTNILLGITREDVKTAANYIRVLAFDDKGAAYLKHVKKSDNKSLPIITNINKDLVGLNDIKKTIEFDIKASDIYNLALGNDLYKESDYVKMPIIIDR